jgi:hypothetical protein
MRNRLTTLLFLSCTVLLMQPMRSIAQEPGEGDGDGRWRFTVAPYLLFPYMDGAVSVLGTDIGVEATPGDIFDALQFGAMLYLEANNGTWGISLDGLYMDLEQTAGILPIEAGVSQGAVELAGYRRVATWAEVLIGGRFNILTASLKGGLGFLDVEEEETWIDPFFGARLQVPETGKWRLSIRGDVGGFGVGAESVWQVYPVVGYRFSRLFEVVAAYRWLDTDYRTGDDPIQFRYDVSTFGPELGLFFHF